MTCTKNNNECDSFPLNKGFLDVHQNFTERGWNIKTNTKNILSYVKSVNVLDEFILNVDKTNISVIIPLPNSNIAYKTSFKNYFEASEYIISRMYDLEHSIR